MIKKFLAVLLILGIVISLICCKKNDELKIKDIANIDYNKITEIHFRSGKGKLIEVKNQEKVKEFTDNILSQYVLTKSKNQQTTLGFLYYVDLYENKENILRIQFDKGLELNNTYYDVIKPVDHMTKLENFINSIK